MSSIDVVSRIEPRGAAKTSGRSSETILGIVPMRSKSATFENVPMLYRNHLEDYHARTISPARPVRRTAPCMSAIDSGRVASSLTAERCLSCGTAAHLLGGEPRRGDDRSSRHSASRVAMPKPIPRAPPVMITCRREGSFQTSATGRCRFASHRCSQQTSVEILKQCPSNTCSSTFNSFSTAHPWIGPCSVMS